MSRGIVTTAFLKQDGVSGRWRLSEEETLLLVSPLSAGEIFDLASGLKIAYESGFLTKAEAETMFRQYAQPPDIPT